MKRPTRNIGSRSSADRDMTNNNSKNIPGRDLSTDTSHNIDSLLETGHLSSCNFSGYLSRHARKENAISACICGRHGRHAEIVA